MTGRNILFPEKYSPSKSAIHAHNELFIRASAEKIWYWLTNASTWPDWYPNSSNIELIGHDVNSHLKANTTFKWRTFNTNIVAEVTEYEVNKRLAWIAASDLVRRFK